MANLQDLFNEIQADSRISNPPTFEEFQSKMEDPAFAERVNEILGRNGYDVNAYEGLKKKEESMVESAPLSQSESEQPSETTEPTQMGGIEPVGEVVSEDPQAETEEDLDPLNADLSAYNMEIKTPLSSIQNTPIQAAPQQQNVVDGSVMNESVDAPKPVNKYKNNDIISLAKNAKNKFISKHIDPIFSQAKQATAQFDQEIKPEEETLSQVEEGGPGDPKRKDVKDAATSLYNEMDDLNYKTASRVLGDTRVLGVKMDGDNYEVVFANNKMGGGDQGRSYKGKVGDVTWEGYISNAINSSELYKDEESWEDLKSAVITQDTYSPELEGKKLSPSFNNNLASHKSKYFPQGSFGQITGTVTIPKEKNKEEEASFGTDLKRFFEKVKVKVKTQNIISKEDEERKEYNIAEETIPKTEYVMDTEQTFYNSLNNTPETNAIMQENALSFSDILLPSSKNKETVMEGIKLFLAKAGYDENEINQKSGVIYKQMLRDARYHTAEQYIRHEIENGNKTYKFQDIDRLNQAKEKGIDELMGDESLVTQSDKNFVSNVWDISLSDYINHYDAKATVRGRNMDIKNIPGKVSAYTARMNELEAQIEAEKVKLQIPSKEQLSETVKGLKSTKDKIDAYDAQLSKMEEDMNSLLVDQDGQKYFKDEASKTIYEELVAQSEKILNERNALVEQNKAGSQDIEKVNQFQNNISRQLKEYEALRKKLNYYDDDPDLLAMRGLSNTLTSIQNYESDKSAGIKNDLYDFQDYREKVRQDDEIARKEAEDDNMLEAGGKGLVGGFANVLIGISKTGMYLGQVLTDEDSDQKEWTGGDELLAATSQLQENVGQWASNPYYEKWGLNWFVNGVGGVVPDLAAVYFTGGGAGFAELATTRGAIGAVGKIATSPTTVYFTVRSTGDYAERLQKAGYSAGEAFLGGGLIAGTEAMLESLLPSFFNTTESISIKSFWKKTIEEGIAKKLAPEVIARQLKEGTIGIARNSGKLITTNTFNEKIEEGTQTLFTEVAFAGSTDETIQIFDPKTGGMGKTLEAVTEASAIGGATGLVGSSAKGIRTLIKEKANNTTLKLTQLQIGRKYTEIINEADRLSKDFKGSEVEKEYEKINKEYKKLSANPNFLEYDDLAQSEVLDKSLALNDLKEAQKNYESQNIVDVKLNNQIAEKEKELVSIINTAQENTDVRNDMNKQLEEIGVKSFTLNANGEVNGITFDEWTTSEEEKESTEKAIEIIEKVYKPKAQENAVQKSSATEVLPRQQGETTETGSQREGMGSSVQGQGTTQEGGKEEITVFRGKGNNVMNSDNDSTLWVAEDEEVAKNYAGVKEDGSFDVEETKISKPQNSIELPYKLATDVKASNIGDNLRLLLKNLKKEGKVSDENVTKILNLISKFENKAGENLELFTTKVNKPESREAFSQVVQALGYDSIVQKESAATNGKKTNTYGVFKTQYPSLVNVKQDGGKEELIATPKEAKEQEAMQNDIDQVQQSTGTVINLNENGTLTINAPQRGGQSKKEAAIENAKQELAKLGYNVESRVTQPDQEQTQQEEVQKEITDEEFDTAIKETENMGVVAGSQSMNELQKRTAQDPKKGKIVAQASRAVNALKSLFPNMNIVVHESDESYNKAMNTLGGTVNTRGQFVYKPSADGNIQGAVHINLNRANSRTIAHEVAHAALLKMFKGDGKVFGNFKDKLKDIAKDQKMTITDKDGNEVETTWGDEAEKLSSRYQTEDQAEEYLAELAGLVAELDINKPENKSILQKIAEFINNFILSNPQLKALGITPISDTSSAEEVLEFFDTLGKKISRGEEIKTDNVNEVEEKPSSNEVTYKLQNDFSDPVSKLTFMYDKNSQEFKNLEKQGYITNNKKLKDFAGKYLFLHQPDAAFSGMIYKNGELLVEGKGGVFYPIKFHKDGYFWASTDTTANKMAKDLNAVLKQNGGTIYMALTSAPFSKLMSSTTMSNAVLDFFSSKAVDKNFKINSKQLKSALLIAANHTKVKTTKNKKTGEVKQKQVGLDLGLSPKASLETIQSKIKEALGPDSSSFDDRKTFVLELTRIMAEEIKNDPTAVKQFGKLFSEGIQNKYFKGESKTGKLKISAANIVQAMSEMFTEPMLKEGVDRSKGGQVYAVLELKGKVKPVDSDKHESYPKAIQSDSDAKVKLHILKDRENWYDNFEDPTTGEIIQEDRRKKLFPTSGVSTMGLKLSPPSKKAGAKSTPKTKPGVKTKAQFDDDVKSVFEENSELASIGTTGEYAEYLDSVFPNSQVKDIVYHGAMESLLPKDNKFKGYVTYFSTSKKYSENFGMPINRKVISAVVDVQSPYNSSSPLADVPKEVHDTDEFTSPRIIKQNAKQYDSVIGVDAGQTEGNTIVIFNPEQIHVLGSNKDVKDFENFVAEKKKGVVAKSQIEIRGVDVTDLFERIGVNVDALERSINAKPSMFESSNQLFKGIRKDLLYAIDSGIESWQKEVDKQASKLKSSESDFGFREKMLSKYSNVVSDLKEIKKLIEEDLLTRSDVKITTNKEKGGVVAKSQMDDVQRTAQMYNMNDQGFFPKNADEFKINRDFERFGLKAKRANASSWGPGSLYLVNQAGRKVNPFNRPKGKSQLSDEEVDQVLKTYPDLKTTQIVDENGNPLIVRHQSQTDIDINNMSDKNKGGIRDILGRESKDKYGIYFSTESAESLKDMFDKTGKGKTYEVFLDVKNLLDLGDTHYFNFETNKPEQLSDAVVKNSDQYLDVRDISKNDVDRVKALGYDGIWGNRNEGNYKGIDEIVVFDKSQIKPVPTGIVAKSQLSDEESEPNQISSSERKIIADRVKAEIKAALQGRKEGKKEGVEQAKEQAQKTIDSLNKKLEEGKITKQELQDKIKELGYNVRWQAAEARLAGEIEGKKAGRAEGRKEGIKEGVEKGKEQAQKTIDALNKKLEEGKITKQELQDRIKELGYTIRWEAGVARLAGEKTGKSMGKKFGEFVGYFKGLKAGRTEQRGLGALVSEYIKDVVDNEFGKKGSISPATLKSISRRAATISNQKQLDAFVSYLDKIIANRRLAEGINEIQRQQKKLLNKIGYQYTSQMKQFAKFDLYTADGDLAFDMNTLEEYLQALEDLNQKVPNIGKMMQLFDDMYDINQQNMPADIDIVEEFKKWQDSSKELFTNTSIGSFEDYRKFKREVGKYMRALNTLLDTGVINESQYEAAKNKVIEDSAPYDAYSTQFQDQIDALKQELVQGITDNSTYSLVDSIKDWLKNSPNTFTENQRKLIDQLLRAKADNLMELSLDDLDLLNQVVVQIAENGFVDEKNLRTLLDRAEIRGNEIGKSLAEQAKQTKGLFRKDRYSNAKNGFINMMNDTLGKSVVFWESRLGMKENGPFRKHLIDPIVRAINGWEKDSQRILKDYQKKVEKLRSVNIFKNPSDIKKLINKTKIEKFKLTSDGNLVPDGTIKVSKDAYDRVMIGVVGHILDNAWNAKQKKKTVSDWLGKQMLSAKVRNNMANEDVNELDIVNNIYNDLKESFPDGNGGLDHMAVLEAFESDPTSVLTGSQLEYYNIARSTLQEAGEYINSANAIRNKQHELNPYYMPRQSVGVREGTLTSTDIAYNKNVGEAIRSGASYQRVLQVPTEAIRYNVDRLVMTNVHEGLRDYYLTEAKRYVRDVFSNAKENASQNDAVMLDNLKQLSDTIAPFALAKSENTFGLSKMMGKFFVDALIGFVRTPIEFTTNLISYAVGNRSLKSLTLPFTPKEKQETDKLLSEFDSSVQFTGLERKVKLSGKKGIDGYLDRESRFSLINKFLNNVTGFMRKGEWKSQFEREFERNTGEKFSYEKHFVKEKGKYYDEMSKAASDADFRMRRIMKGGNKAEQRQFIEWFPFVKSARISADSKMAPFVGMFSGFINHDADNLNIGLRKAVTQKEIKDGLTQALGAYGRLSLYPVLMVIGKAIANLNLGDDDEKKEAQETLDSLKTPKGWSDMALFAAKQVGATFFGGKYAAGGKIIGNLLLDAAYTLSDDRRQRRLIEDTMRDLYFVDPIDFYDLPSEKDDMALQIAANLQPIVGMVIDGVSDFANDVKNKGREQVTLYDIYEWTQQTEEGKQWMYMANSLATLGQTLTVVFTPGAVPFIDDYVRWAEDELSQKEPNENTLYKTPGGEVVDIRELFLDDSQRLPINTPGISSRERDKYSILATEKFNKAIKKEEKQIKGLFPDEKYLYIDYLADKAKYEAGSELGFPTERWSEAEGEMVSGEPIPPSERDNTPESEVTLEKLHQEIMKGKQLSFVQNIKEKRKVEDYMFKEFDKAPNMENDYKNATIGGKLGVREYFKAKYLYDKYKLTEPPVSSNYFIKEKGQIKQVESTPTEEN